MNQFVDYRNLLIKALSNVDESKISEMEKELTRIAHEHIPLLTCGNGGSAAITEHLSCDHTKGVAMDTKLHPFVIPLQSNVSLNTAIANDIGYDEVFSKQIEWWLPVESALLIVSSSGNSPNVINALVAARRRNMSTMAMVGFGGGEILKNNLADIIVHVNSDNYGIVEDAHQIIMHSMAQSIRLKHCKDGHKLKL